MTDPHSVKRILVVCVGNVCRSPIGERILTERLPHIDVSSAGIGALVGHEANSLSAEVAANRGLSLEGHVARQFTGPLGQDSDLVLVMEPGHRREIGRQAPHLLGRTMMFDHWTERAGIPDPYQKSRKHHEAAFDLISAAADAWVERLNRRRAA